MFNKATMLHPPTMAKSQAFTNLTNLFNMVLFWALVLHGLLCLGLRWLLNGAAALQSVSNPGSLLYALLFVFVPLFLTILMFLDSLDLLWMIVWIPVRLAARPALPALVLSLATLTFGPCRWPLHSEKSS